MRRAVLSCVFALLTGAGLLVVTTTPAQAATICDGNVGRTHSTSWREGRVYVRSCAGAAGYGVVGISDLSPLNLQLRNVRVSTWVYRSSDRKLVGDESFYVLEASAGRLWKNIAQTRCGYVLCPEWRGTPGTRYYSVTTVSYDVKDDGKGYFSLTSTSPHVVA